MLALAPNRLRYPDMPCVNCGTFTKPVWLPAELCYIVKGQRRLKLDESQVRKKKRPCRLYSPYLCTQDFILQYTSWL